MAKVVFTEPAEYDLLDIEYYIFVDLCNPQASQRISDGILDVADRLSEYPERYPLIDDELLKRIGLRVAYFDNYNIFYHYDSGDDIVYIIRILYHKADWQNILKRP
ncbi:MAG: type II toxin-antitoxin system RelE/ParE family toxin [Kineothrix sp.]|nr:type II toxin-antitoxin system RelE/ParE family toxin [Kineothrix sp.]